MTLYIFNILVFQALFYIAYRLFLRSETGFKINRMYLLLAPLVSLVLPFIKIPVFQTQEPVLTTYLLPEILIGETHSNVQIVVNTGNPFSWIHFLWISGMLLSLTLFVLKLLKINRLKAYCSNKRIIKDTAVYMLPKTKEAFSFINSVFIGEDLSETQKQTVLLHEQVHLSHKHGWDLLYFELLRIVFWFNPFLYLFQKELKLLHEYIADHIVIKKTGKQSYYQSLLSQAFKTTELSFINTFFNHSLIKKRIIMLQKSNQKPNPFKYLLLLPLLGAMLFYSSCEQQTATDAEVTATDKIAELKEILKTQELTSEQRAELVRLAYPDNPPAPSTPPVPNKNGDVSFASIDKAPVFPGCENQSTNEAKKQCFSEKLTKFILENFDTSIAKKLGLTGKQRIITRFKIDKTGNIVGTKARAPHPDLETEAVRVINLLPKLQPGMHNGKPVGVLYALPILFEVQ